MGAAALWRHDMLLSAFIDPASVLTDFLFRRLCCVQVPGGIIEDSCVLRGVMVNKDVTHPRMRRMIRDPRIVLLDCSLEYKKGESQVTHTRTHTHVVRSGNPSRVVFSINPLESTAKSRD